MEKIIVEGGNKLNGEVNISLAKNSVLPIIVASILSPNDIIIKNAPMLEDVVVLTDLLSGMNCQIENDSNGDLKINTTSIKETDMNSELIRKMRASFLIMGPMLSRFGRCKISMPGGCNIGSRPIDLHLKGFKLLGAEIEMGHGFVEAKAKKLKGNRIYLDFPSVGATENILMASVLAQGTTIIENAAEEPEIWDLANFLNSMGAKIHGAGMGKITVEGVKELKGVTYKPIYDRVEAGTFMVAAAITNSKITINGANEEQLRPTIEKLKECGVKFKNIKEEVYINFTYLNKENRFMHVAELVRMGASIKIDGRTAIIEGVESLTGCEVKATDLRAGAAMILAGLVAQGETEISDIYHIDRGYVNIEGKFRGLGANIYRVDR